MKTPRVRDLAQWDQLYVAAVKGETKGEVLIIMRDPVDAIVGFVHLTRFIERFAADHPGAIDDWREHVTALRKLMDARDDVMVVPLPGFGSEPSS